MCMVNTGGAWLSLVERCVRDAEVASSNLVAPIVFFLLVFLILKHGRLRQFEAWLSLVERRLREAEVASSNLVASINE